MFVKCRLVSTFRVGVPRAKGNGLGAASCLSDTLPSTGASDLLNDGVSGAREGCNEVASLANLRNVRDSHSSIEGGRRFRSRCGGGRTRLVGGRRTRRRRLGGLETVRDHIERGSSQRSTSGSRFITPMDGSRVTHLRQGQEARD